MHCARRRLMLHGPASFETALTYPDILQRPKTTAHCVAGLVRSLPQPLVYRSLRRNMLDSFGGTPSVFLVIKIWNPATKHAGHFPSSAAEDLAQGTHWSDEQAEEFLRPVLAELKPLVAGIRLLNASEDTADQLINRRCSVQGRHYGLKSGVYTTEAGLVRLVGQAAASDACLRMIETSERAAGVRFDFVTRSRPDLAYLAPVRSWRSFPEPRVAYIHDRDWLIVVHRSLADAALGSFALYNNCTTRRTEETPEAWLRLAIRHGGGDFRVADFPVGMMGAERCSDACPLHSIPTNSSDGRQRMVVRDASAEGFPFVGYFHGECKAIGSFVGCFGDVPLHCRSNPCMQMLASSQQRASFAALGHSHLRSGVYPDSSSARTI